MLDARAALRLVLGFLAAVGFWFVFSAPYERALAAGGQALLGLFERPSVTRLSAHPGEIRIDRRDFPPGSPRPGLPAADLHFNFVLLAALFALSPRPARGANVARFLIACAALFLGHLVALVFQVQGIYARNLGEWSRAHYGALARNFWAGGFHFYQIAGRFALPFGLWWMLGREPKGEGEEKGKRRRKRL
jgi:hypothetical protein